MPEVGDRIRIPSINRTGTIEYIDQKTIFIPHYYPIQVKLDESFEGQMMQRTNLKDMINFQDGA